MSKTVPWLLLAAFFAVLASRMHLTMAQTDVYPEFSTLRSDPAGAKALFDSLAGMPALRPARNYRPWTESQAAGRTFVFLGAAPSLLTESAKWDQFLRRGGTAIVALRPPPKGQRPRTERLGFVQMQDAGANARLSLRGNNWRCLDGDDAACRIAEKPTAKGRILLTADATPFANRALHDHPDTALLSNLFPARGALVFDESHLGVEDSGGVGVLARQYGLMPAFAILLAAAGLFLWRGGTTLLPEREPVPPALEPKPSASLETLLAQTVPPSKLLDTLAAEWRRALPLLPPWQRARVPALEAALESARANKDRHQAYRQLQSALTLRKDPS